MSMPPMDSRYDQVVPTNGTTNQHLNRSHYKKSNNMLGPYVMLQTVGEGEFAKVKLAMHIETGEEAAIKLIRKENVDSSNRLAKIQREISVLRSVRHPNVVKLYDVIETDKYIGIVMEYASGKAI
jgi:serine/threonine protein kinase